MTTLIDCSMREASNTFFDKHKDTIGTDILEEYIPNDFKRIQNLSVNMDKSGSLSVSISQMNKVNK